MRFEHPNLMWLLLLVPPALALFFWWRERVKQKLLTQFVEVRLLERLTAGISPQRRKIRFSLLILASAFLIVTVARPQRGFDLQEVEQRGLDIVVAVDTSKSMLATDIAPNRLERAKLAALELMQRAASDRLGLVAFAGNAFLECPLTIDNTAFQQSAQALNVNSVSEGGTAIAEAIHTAQTAFKEGGGHRVLVLMTDGEDNFNDAAAVAAAQDAAKADLIIFTVGIGSKDGTLVTIHDANGNSDYLRDEQGNVHQTKLNEPLLQEIARTTGGAYLPLQGAKTMDTLYESGLAPLPKTVGKEKLIKQYHEQYQWPLAAAILLLLAEILLPERQKAKGKRQKEGNVATTLAASVTAVLFLPVAANTSPSSALRDYKSGNFTNALAEFTQLAAVRTNDLRLVFNAGDAAYRATNFDLAQNLFQQATLSPDLKLQQQAFYNLGNVQFQSAKLAKDLDGLQQGLEIAAKTYERAVSLNTNDADANFNLAFTKNAIEQIRAFRAAIQRAKSQADAAVQRAEFHTAFEIMQNLTQNYKIAAKQFEEFTTKLKNIDEIENPPRQP
jgi:Ca-activated chloride channel family protein